MTKKIGILTSGGDCAGLNAVIRAVTLRAINKYDWRVYGIKEGTLGLMSDNINVIEKKCNSVKSISEIIFKIKIHY